MLIKGSHLKRFINKYPKYRQHFEHILKKSNCQRCGTLNDVGKISLYNFLVANSIVKVELKKFLNTEVLQLRIKFPKETRKRIVEIK